MGVHVSFFLLPPSYWISKNTVGVLAYFSAIWLQKLCLSDQLQVPEWLFIHGLVVFGMKFGDCKTPNFWQNPSLKGTFWNKFECCATWLFFGGGSRGGQPCVWTNVWWAGCLHTSSAVIVVSQTGSRSCHGLASTEVSLWTTYPAPSCSSFT